jgi:hypothetical protein
VIPQHGETPSSDAQRAMKKRNSGSPDDCVFHNLEYEEFNISVSISLALHGLDLVVDGIYGSCGNRVIVIGRYGQCQEPPMRGSSTHNMDTSMW